MRHELSISEMIGADFFGEGMSGSRFKQMFDGLGLAPTDELLVRLNSPGGDVWDGMQIHNVIKSHPGKKIVQIDGAALSAASFIAMAGDTIRMAQAGILMIHNPWSLAIGDSREMRKQGDILDKHRDTIVPLYAKQTGKRPETITRLLDAETWMTPEEALAEGFIDEIGTTEATPGAIQRGTEEESRMALALMLKLNMFQHPPKTLLEKPEEIDQQKIGELARLALSRKRLDIDALSV